ncbi:MAG: AbiH family protein [Phocaeicola vulgatus]
MNAINRIILVGNGFDLAHGLATRYADFINWYWEKIFKSFKNVS